jgi:hypothetical protein
MSERESHETGFNADLSALIDAYMRGASAPADRDGP